jgi:uncharacterized membrane protein
MAQRSVFITTNIIACGGCILRGNETLHLAKKEQAEGKKKIKKIKIRGREEAVGRLTNKAILSTQFSLVSGKEHFSLAKFEFSLNSGLFSPIKEFRASDSSNFFFF